MIKSYSYRDTEKLANNYRVRSFMASERIAQSKLMQRKAAATLDMLRAKPGNRLEALKIVREDLIVSVLTDNVGFVFDLRMVVLITLKLWTTTGRLI